MKKRAGILGAALLAFTLTACSSAATGQADYIGQDAAKAVALEAAGIQEGAAVFSSTGLNQKEGLDYYAVSFAANGQNYEYDVDALTGVVIETHVSQGGANSQAEAAASPGQVPAVSTPVSSSGSQSSGTILTADQAKEKALAHAGLTSSQVTMVKCQLDWENGRQVYDVEFYGSNYAEYDYEIDASTGAVLEYDYDAESITPNGSGSQALTAEEAKALALAQVPGATAADIYEFEVDYDDGRVEYEGNIIYNSMKYEFQIDGHSGSIREWEAERLGS